jgi:hypothetical protein
MSESIVVALITGGLAIVSNIISVFVTSNKTLYRVEQLEKQNSDIKKVSDNLDNLRTDVELIKLTQENLTSEVRKHNGVIERVFIVEKTLELLEERQRVANHRISDLEKDRHDYRTAEA